MNIFTNWTLKVLRKCYIHFYGKQNYLPSCNSNPDEVSQLIYNALVNNKPCMIARFGSVELNAISNYKYIKQNKKNYSEFIKGKSPQWWWNKKGLQEMCTNAGFFPATPQMVSKFSEMMINDMNYVDILGSWRPEETYFQKELNKAIFVKLHLLEPFWSKKAWTQALAGKKILVIHPFAQTIETQYRNRKLLFKNPDILPPFELKIIKAVQSIGGDSLFNNWFDALQWMKDEMDKIDYDICLIGCGAYGFPLAAHAKRKGKKAIHLGGALQLLFGIKGKRWSDPNYGVKKWHIPYGSYSSLINDYWVSPSSNEKPENANRVENGCYW